MHSDIDIHDIVYDIFFIHIILYIERTDTIGKIIIKANMQLQVLFNKIIKI